MVTHQTHYLEIVCSIHTPAPKICYYNIMVLCQFCNLKIGVRFFVVAPEIWERSLKVKHLVEAQKKLVRFQSFPPKLSTISLVEKQTADNRWTAVRSCHRGP